MGYRVERWGEPLPSRDEIEQRMNTEGLRPYSWSNGPGDRYSEHSHGYRKVLFCVRGTITFRVQGADVTLHRGDRLELDPGTAHSAIVGAQGVECLESPA